MKRIALERRLPGPRRPSAVARFSKAVAYGPFGFIQPPVVGFILGTGAFLLRDAFVAEHNVVEELPQLLMLALGTALAFFAAAIAANYAIGRRIRDDLELQAKIQSGQAFVIPTPRTDLPGIDLLVRSGTATGDSKPVPAGRYSSRVRSAARVLRLRSNNTLLWHFAIAGIGLSRRPIVL